MTNCSLNQLLVLSWPSVWNRPNYPLKLIGLSAPTVSFTLWRISFLWYGYYYVTSLLQNCISVLFSQVIKQRSDKGDAEPAPDGADEKVTFNSAVPTDSMTRLIQLIHLQGSALRKCIVGAFTVCSVPLAVAAIIIIATAWFSKPSKSLIEIVSI